MGTNSEGIKYYSKLKQKKYREERREFLIEGIHLIEECLRSKYYRDKIWKIFIRSDFPKENIRDNFRDVEINVLKAVDFKKLTETESSQGIIGAVEMQNEFPNQNDNIICALERINDPGNLGTIMRTCRWFGIESILISRDSADIYNSKVIRASQGALFNLNIKSELNLIEELELLNGKGYEIISTDLSANETLGTQKFQKDKKYVIVFGNEANGLSQEIKSIPFFKKIKIESYSDCESLNVASSAAIILYEVKKNTV